MNIYCIALLLVTIHSCGGTISISIAPYNTTAGVGRKAYLACIVADKGTDSVKWEKEGVTTSLTIDGTAVDTTSKKYEVAGLYNLTINDVVRGDEGGYTCKAGSSITKTAYLTVVDFPTNVSVYWSNPPVAGTRANLTCKATRANPAPAFKWYKDERVYDYPAVFYTTQSYSGYVDAYSVLAVQLSNSDESSRFRCQLEYTGLSRAMEADIVTELTSNCCKQTINIIVLFFGALVTFLTR